MAADDGIVTYADDGGHRQAAPPRPAPLHTLLLDLFLPLCQNMRTI